MPEVMNTVPNEIQKRLDGWFYCFWGFTICYYLFGIAGVLCSTIAAASDDKVAIKVFTVIASGCVAFVGFVQPDRQYRKYVVAWRLLDEKVNLYRHGLIDIRELVEGMAGAERALDQIERDTSNNKQPPAAQPQPQPQAKPQPQPQPQPGNLPAKAPLPHEQQSVNPQQGGAQRADDRKAAEPGAQRADQTPPPGQQKGQTDPPPKPE